MSGINYLDGSIYHMTHFDTSKGIFQRRAILCKVSVGQEKIPYRSIANDEVQDFRDRILIWDFSRGRYRFLHSYVPFYFATRPPMLHNMFTRGIQNEIVIFEVDRSILRDQGVLFTDGNASNQQLSKFRGVCTHQTCRSSCSRYCSAGSCARYLCQDARNGTGY